MASNAASDLGREILDAYLPRTLVEHWSADPTGPAVWSEELAGSLMLCDMSGFTAMSERLARLGNEGAELMAGILNRFFDRMLRIADGWGGVQMKFGGDAMLLYFGGDAHAARAAACAMDMQRAMPQFASVRAGGETHRLRMRVGIHSGTFVAASAGDSDGLLHYLLLGPDVNETARMEGEAQPGQVVVSPAAARLLPEDARLVRTAGDALRVMRVPPPSPPPSPRDTSAAPSAVLLRYLLPPLAAPLAEGRTPNMVAEHRRVTAVFINLFGVTNLLREHGTSGMLAQVDRYMNMVMENLRRHGGFLGGSDAAEHGDKVIALFGAPISSERQESRALQFALDLHDELTVAGLSLSHRIGISAGYVFAGEIGSPIRREYTVIGDSVNLAARLMAAASPGEIYVSGQTLERAREEFAVRQLRPLSVKGKSAPVAAFRLEGRVAASAARPAEQPRALVGRGEELRELAALSRGARRGRGRWAYVSGEPGIGKSTLIQHAAGRVAGQGWGVISTSCQAHLANTILSAWIEPLRAVAGVPGDARGDDGWRALRDGIARLAPDQVEFAPLIADVLALPSDDEPMLRFLDAKTRRQLMHTTIRKLLAARARQEPLLIVFEDTHHADAASLELLSEALHDLPASLMFWLTSRGGDPPAELGNVVADADIRLHELPRDDARRLALAMSGLDEQGVDAIVARAQGNPLFIEEMARTAMRGEALPQTVNEVIMSRIDHLPFEEKTVIRVASVAGSNFNVHHVEEVLAGKLEADATRAALRRLSEQGFVRELGEEETTHGFAHVLTQEVVYETLLFAQRRELHAAIGSLLEREAPDRIAALSGLLLHHFERAGHRVKTVRYAARTGDRAASVFANREAIDYYTRALDALQHVPKARASDRSVLLEKIGDCLEIDGRHAAAASAYQDALDEWRSGAGRMPTVLRGELTQSGWRDALLCRKVAVAYERNSDYDTSLRWLEDALMALPARAASVASEIFASRSMALFRKGEYREAIASGRRALAMARRTRDARRVAYARNMLANSYLEEGSVRLAIRELEGAVRLYTEMDDVYGQAAANNNLGNCYQAIGMLDSALAHYRTALAADTRMGKNGAIIHNNIGEVLVMQGKYDDAGEHLEHVVRANEGDANLNAVAGLSLVNLSRCHMGQADLAAAERDLRRGMKLLKQVGARALIAEARVQQAELRLAEGKAQAALREARDALGLARALDAKLVAAAAERVVGEAHTVLGAAEKACAHLSAAAETAAGADAALEEARALIALARVTGAPLGQSLRKRLERASDALARMGAARELAETERLLGPDTKHTAARDAERGTRG